MPQFYTKEGIPYPSVDTSFKNSKLGSGLGYAAKYLSLAVGIIAIMYSCHYIQTDSDMCTFDRAGIKIEKLEKKVIIKVPTE